MNKTIKAILGAPKVFAQRRAARRKPTGFEFVFADKVDFVNAQHWDALASKTVFLSRDYLRVLELYAPENLVPRYAICYQGGVPAAVMLVQRIAVSGDRLQKKREARLRDKPLSGYGEHLLLCGNVLVWGARGFATGADVDPAGVWAAMAQALYSLRRSDKLVGESDLLMIKDIPSPDAVAADTLRLLGYRSIQTEPDMVLTLRPEWKQPQDYLASLTSGYRSNAKKLIKDCVAAGVVFRLIDAAEMLRRADELHQLYLQVHEGQPLRLATLHPLYLPAMAQIFGDRFRCRVAEIAGQAVGFVTSVKDGDSVVGYFIGYDKATNERAPIYLTLLRSCVDDAIEMGAKTLSIGRTALEPKAKMGCKPQAFTCAVKHRVSALNLIVSAITHNATHAEPPDRSPFKIDPPADAGPAAGSEQPQV